MSDIIIHQIVIKPGGGKTWLYHNYPKLFIDVDEVFRTLNGHLPHELGRDPDALLDEAVNLGYLTAKSTNRIFLSWTQCPGPKYGFLELPMSWYEYVADLRGPSCGDLVQWSKDALVTDKPGAAIVFKHYSEIVSYAQSHCGDVHQK